MDLFTVPTLTLDALYCFFVIAHKRAASGISMYQALGKWLDSAAVPESELLAHSTGLARASCTLIVTPSYWLACLFPSLDSGNSLVLQYPHHDAPILRLRFNRFVSCNLTALSHRAWCQHVGQGNMTLLPHEISDIVGAFFA